MVLCASLLNQFDKKKMRHAPHFQISFYSLLISDCIPFHDQMRKLYRKKHIPGNKHREYIKSLAITQVHVDGRSDALGTGYLFQSSSRGHNAIQGPWAPEFWTYGICKL